MANFKRILIVEDEPEFRLAMKMRLEAAGHLVLEAEDGASGLDAARTLRPDIILLDIMLPRMDGYQVARLLKFDEAYRDIPIVMLTARSQQADRETGRNCGADAYLTKPVAAEELLQTLDRLLSSPAAEPHAS